MARKKKEETAVEMEMDSVALDIDKVGSKYMLSVIKYNSETGDAEVSEFKEVKDKTVAQLFMNKKEALKGLLGVK